MHNTVHWLDTGTTPSFLHSPRMTRYCGTILRNNANTRYNIFGTVITTKSLSEYSRITAEHTQELMEGVFLLSSPPLPFLYPFLSLPLLSPPLRSRAPLNQLAVWGSAVSSPSGVQGRNEFGAL